MNQKPINQYAIGVQFLNYCVCKEWLTQEGNSKNKRWYLTKKGENGLKKFGIGIVFEKNEK